VEVHVDQPRRYEEATDVDHRGALSGEIVAYFFYDPVAHADVE
jgi:hypothetical protein